MFSKINQLFSSGDDDVSVEVGVGRESNAMPILLREGELDLVLSESELQDEQLDDIVSVNEDWGPIGTDKMDREKDDRTARIHGSTLSLEEYALKLNTFRLRYKLPDRTTCALLKLINEIFGQKDCETNNRKKRLPTTIKRPNKLSFSLCNKDCLLTYRTINTGHMYGYTSVFELVPQLRDIIQRKSFNNQNTRQNEINIKNK